MRKSKKESLAIVAIAGAVMIALSLKSLSPSKLKNKSHFKWISLPNSTKQLALAPLCQCPCLCLKTSISFSLVISLKAIGKVLGQVNLVHHSEKSKIELSLANWPKNLHKFTSWYLSSNILWKILIIRWWKVFPITQWLKVVNIRRLFAVGLRKRNLLFIKKNHLLIN